MCDTIEELKRNKGCENFETWILEQGVTSEVLGKLKQDEWNSWKGFSHLDEHYLKSFQISDAQKDLILSAVEKIRINGVPGCQSSKEDETISFPIQETQTSQCTVTIKNGSTFNGAKKLVMLSELKVAIQTIGFLQVFLHDVGEIWKGSHSGFDFYLTDNSKQLRCVCYNIHLRKAFKILDRKYVKINCIPKVKRFQSSDDPQLEFTELNMPVEIPKFNIEYNTRNQNLVKDIYGRITRVGKVDVYECCKCCKKGAVKRVANGVFCSRCNKTEDISERGLKAHIFVTKNGGKGDLLEVLMFKEHIMVATELSAGEVESMGDSVDELKSRLCRGRQPFWITYYVKNRAVRSIRS